MQCLKSVTLLTFAICTLTSPLYAEGVKVKGSYYHKDFRNSPKLLYDIEQDKQKRSLLMTGDAVAEQYIRDNFATFQLPENGGNLTLVKTKGSKLAKHYHYQQYLNEIAVEGGELIISVSNSNEIIKVYNNTFPQNSPVAFPETIISQDDAIDIAWNYLRVHGDIMSLPEAELLYSNNKGEFDLIYKVQVNVEKPYGYWEVRIDAVDGRVISAKTTQIERKAKSKPAKKEKFTGVVWDRADAIANYLYTKSESQQISKTDSVGAKANATAKVFDPDPMTAINSDTIHDSSPASAFTSAYVTRTLRDLDYNGGVYSLVGPWIKIIDFDPPTDAPSTSTTGSWVSTRGNNSFNDVMTYFHIDQNQRYIQSLGFTGSNGIQELSIEVDSNGNNGEDNSYYFPGGNQISFGHGGVDDNEDADVVLHEYFHALQYDMNSNWAGGDTGAMGEGFGDYWGASYSYTTTNGATFHPEWAFGWDGHSSGAWGGRFLNMSPGTHQYDPTKTYPAHVLVGGINGDELWGTPLFQAFLVLVEDFGVSREDIDTIILESNFGLGYGLTMPEMATAIVNTAATLFPAGPHASVFYTKFKDHKILQDPTLSSSGAIVANSVGYTIPGDTAAIQVPLTASGDNFTNITGVLTTSEAGVIINQNSSLYPDITMGATQNNVTNYSLTIPESYSCGDSINITLQTSYTRNGSPGVKNIATSLRIGTGSEVGYSQSPALAIPDNNPTGVSSQMVITGTNQLVSADFNIDIDLSHTYTGDLTIKITSPNNTTVVLAAEDLNGENIVGNFPADFSPTGDLSSLVGGPLDGTWTIEVSDGYDVDIGTLNSWTINDMQYTCMPTANITPILHLLLN